MTDAAPSDQQAPDEGRKSAPRRRGMASIAANLPRVLGPAMKKRGVAIARLIAHWPQVVGPELAEVSQPERLARGKDGAGTLHVKVSGPFALEMQHLEPLVLEKINGFLGQGLVQRLKLVQGTVPVRPARRTPPSPPNVGPADEARLGTIVAEVEDDELRAALERLGRSILSQEDVGHDSG